MDKTQTMKEFLATQGAQINIFDFVINLLLASALAYILGLLYKKYGVTLLMELHTGEVLLQQKNWQLYRLRMEICTY